MASISKGILLRVSKFLGKIIFQLMFEVNWPTSGLSANCSKLLLVSDTANFFVQNMCFLKNVLVSIQKNLSIKSFRDGEPVS